MLFRSVGGKTSILPPAGIKLNLGKAQTQLGLTCGQSLFTLTFLVITGGARDRRMGLIALPLSFQYFFYLLFIIVLVSCHHLSHALIISFTLAKFEEDQKSSVMSSNKS